MSDPLEPERWARVDALFDQASRRPAHERAAFLAEACGGDEALRREVESLLASAESGVSRGVEAVGRVADRLWSAGSTRVGQRFGAYRSVEEIGRGGMGLVYRAIRDLDDFAQTVAVKTLPRALASRKATERFRNERSILAGLEHPNIARLLDGGTTPEGVPYVVMEFVDGVPVDRYCDEHGLDLVARIRLFLVLCDAVAYAHRHLVVHRDLKPSNVLVTREGVLKLLDFGIAKLVDAEGTAEVQPTLSSQSLVMTPRFASPEQLMGKQAATPSDVYSLGVVLYRLLTGAHPFDEPGESASGPFDVARRALEGRPTPPSQASGDARLKGDLDAVLLKALSRKVEDRYESAQALADDLGRYLAGRPVAARPASWSYRAVKFLYRNRAAVAVSAVAAVLILAQSGITLRRMARERDVARREVMHAAVARAEMLGTLGAAYAKLGVLDTARAVLERESALRDSLYGPEALEVAAALEELGGVLVRQGNLERADSVLQRALAIRRAKLPPEDPSVERLVAAVARVRGRLPDGRPQ